MAIDGEIHFTIDFERWYWDWVVWSHRKFLASGQVTSFKAGLILIKGARIHVGAKVPRFSSLGNEEVLCCLPARLLVRCICVQSFNRCAKPSHSQGQKDQKLAFCVAGGWACTSVFSKLRTFFSWECFHHLSSTVTVVVPWKLCHVPGARHIKARVQISFFHGMTRIHWDVPKPASPARELTSTESLNLTSLYIYTYIIYIIY